MSKITDCKVRMYRAGTGDCFLLRFYAEDMLKFTVLIDGGVWQGSKAYLQNFVEDIASTCDKKLDLLIVTHEHTDHVLMFDRCAALFSEFEIKEIWLGWTENDKDRKVKEWKDAYGEKKKALALAAQRLNGLVNDEKFNWNLDGNRHVDKIRESRMHFSEVLNGFSDLHVNLKAAGEYKGGLRGMEVVKKELNATRIRYLEQGQVIDQLAGLTGMKIYILGPPNLFEEVDKESGEQGESYSHNKELDEGDLFSLALLNGHEEPLKEEMLPFDRNYFVEDEALEKVHKEYLKKVPFDNERCPDIHEANPKRYYLPTESWRKIDYEWLMSSGSLALRMNSLTNNLSLALAFEFEESGKVMLFPGDAEFGSWESWHRIPWTDAGSAGKHLTEDLLNRTVFYKVAHHLSHNGTAKEKGLDMMKHKELTAMATLDYSSISSGWTNTMPNRAIVKDLLQKTQGRLIVLNDEDIPYDFQGNVSLAEKIKQERERMNPEEKANFELRFSKGPEREISYKQNGQTVKEKKILYFEYTVSGG